MKMILLWLLAMAFYYCSETLLDTIAFVSVNECILQTVSLIFFATLNNLLFGEYRLWKCSGGV